MNYLYQESNEPQKRQEQQLSFHTLNNSSNNYSFFHAIAEYSLNVQQFLPDMIYSQDKGNLDEKTFFFSKHALRDVIKDKPYPYYVCDLSLVKNLSLATAQLISRRTDELFSEHGFIFYVVPKSQVSEVQAALVHNESITIASTSEEAYKMCMKYKYKQHVSDYQNLEHLDKHDLINIVQAQKLQQDAIISLMMSSSEHTQEAISQIREKIDVKEKEDNNPSSLNDIKALLNNFENDVLNQLQEKEEALNRKTANLYAVIESTDMCVGLLDEEGNLVDCNQRFTSFFENFFGQQLEAGQKLMTLEGMSTFQQQWQQYFNEAIKGEQCQFSEILSTNGKSAILNIKLFPIFREQKVRGISCFIQDLTKKQQEEALFRLLNSAIVHTNDAILITEVKSLDFIHGHIIYVNRSFTSLTGYEEDEVIGNSHNLLYGSLTSTDALDTINQAVQNGEPVRTEIINYKKDASYYWVDFSIVPLKNDQGEVTHWISIHRDISARKKAEEKVRHQERFLESINKNIKEAILRTDALKHLQYTNQSFRDLFGYRDENISLEELFANKEAATKFEEALNKGMVNNRSFQFKRKDGTTFWGLTSFIINEDQGIKYYDGAIRDITERKESEKILQEKNTALQKTNEELDRFVYSASHDLRAPLASSLGLINISRFTQNESERMSYLDMMEQSLNKMDKIIQDITDYSRNARLEIECEEIHFESLITDVLQRLKYLEHIDDVNIHTFIGGESKFYTDKIRLYVILINLISNAIKYHKYEETNPYINIKVMIKPDEAHILVEDNGIGIEEKHLDKIFGMFFQAARESSGSGLGLFIVKETINKLDGSISVQSKLKEGSCFEVILPNEIHGVDL
ncbi:PAS domain S-box-containing protein [Catalinimonas alkaloidigena]|uniref:PAS domain-containing sensor histidine kinase n=1 Tax=Catalinimonas alkaloidigena TaxID=1075417 RepID=UPI0024053D0B|nr:PAS domain S-box protein [Catalinimonas alkaloidigena]MDF9795801.1 PAS domain S-box-containing protein [Catalinimonas alkaloidigena]